MTHNVYVPEFTFTVSVPPGADEGAGQSLTCSEIAGELRRLADDLERDGNGAYPPDFSGEWHTVHPKGAVVSNAFWHGTAPYTGEYPDREENAAARREGYPEGAWRPWLAANWAEDGYFEVTPADWT